MPRLSTLVLVANSWLPLTAPVLVALKAPVATLVNAVEIPPLLNATLALVPASSCLTPTAAVFTTLLLRWVKASPTLLLSRVPVLAPLLSMVAVVKIGVFQTPVVGSCAVPPSSALTMFPFWALALVARSLS